MTKADWKKAFIIWGGAVVVVAICAALVVLVLTLWQDHQLLNAIRENIRQTQMQQSRQMPVQSSTPK